MKTYLAAALGLATALVASLATRASDALPAGELPRPGLRHEQPHVPNLESAGFNDRASSVIVQRGHWEVCEQSRFRGTVSCCGRASILRSVRWGSMTAFRRCAGWAARITPMRPPRGRPVSVLSRIRERLYPADVIATRAVVGPPSSAAGWSASRSFGRVTAQHSRCNPRRRARRRHRSPDRRRPGSDVATAVGAIGGAALGANVNRGADLHAGCAAVLGRSGYRAGRVLGRDLHRSPAASPRPAGLCTGIDDQGQRPRRAARLTPVKFRRVTTLQCGAWPRPTQH